MADALQQEALPPTTEELPDSAYERIMQRVARGEMTLTPMGKKMLEARRQIELSGIPLLTREELEQEKAERRGGVENRAD